MSVTEKLSNFLVVILNFFERRRGTLATLNDFSRDTAAAEAEPTFPNRQHLKLYVSSGCT